MIGVDSSKKKQRENSATSFAERNWIFLLKNACKARYLIVVAIILGFFTKNSDRVGHSKARQFYLNLR